MHNRVRVCVGVLVGTDSILHETLSVTYRLYWTVRVIAIGPRYFTVHDIMFQERNGIQGGWWPPTGFLTGTGYTSSTSSAVISVKRQAMCRYC